MVFKYLVVNILLVGLWGELRINNFVFFEIELIRLFILNWKFNFFNKGNRIGFFFIKLIIDL